MVSEEYTDVTADGGVKKRVLSEGTGEVPPLHAQCLGKAMRQISTDQELAQRGPHADTVIASTSLLCAD